MKMHPMACRYCQRQRLWPRDFPVRCFVRCYWCYPMNQRIKAQEWQVPPSARFWRTDLEVFR